MRNPFGPLLNLAWIPRGMGLTNNNSPGGISDEDVRTVLDVAQGGIPWSSVQLADMTLVNGNLLGTYRLPSIVTTPTIDADWQAAFPPFDSNFSWLLLQLSVSYTHTAGTAAFFLGATNGILPNVGPAYNIIKKTAAAGLNSYSWADFSPSLRPLWVPPGWQFTFNSINVASDPDDEFDASAIMLKVPAKFYPGCS